MTKPIQVNLSNELEILNAIAVLTDERDEIMSQLELGVTDKVELEILENAESTCETMIALFDEILRLRQIIKKLRGN